MVSGIGLLIGRVLVAAIFLASGVAKLLSPGTPAAELAAKGFPLPWPSALAAGLFLVLAALAIITGWRVRVAALALVAFTLLATVLFHDVWNAPPEMAEMQGIHVMKNLAIIGGLLLLAAAGPGPLAWGRSKP